jgi:mannose-6-phosphate isomerase
VFYIPAGRVHTLGGGVVIAEIQQTSDVTYRIYDWDRTGLDGKPRELHRDLARDVIDYSKSTDSLHRTAVADNQAVELLSCQYFTTNLLRLNSPIERDYSKYDSFIIYICTDGQAEIEYNSEKTIIKKGETVLIPAAIENLGLNSDNADILEIYINEDHQKNK